MKIAVAGIGYVGLSNAILLAQNHNVTAVDVCENRVKLLNERQNPIVDAEISKYLSGKSLRLTATTSNNAYADAAIVIVATPTNYDAISNVFDTSSIDTVIATVTEQSPDALIVIKSTIPVGFVEEARAAKFIPVAHRHQWRLSAQFK